MIQTVTKYPGGSVAWHRATCHCGWLGEKRKTKGEAEVDHAAHHKSHNPK